MKRSYPAFISYRHADNKESGRQWASWLHHALETYEIPADLVGKATQNGQTIPERIFPIFRDEDELPADSNLGQAITRALDASDTLIVLCSPRAVQSTYVASEIDYFKRAGKSDRILAVIIDGEPNVSIDASKQTQGWSAQDECFPKPLQIEYVNGTPSDLRAEPIAADFRVNEGGQTRQGWTSIAAYREDLRTTQGLSAQTIDQRCTSYEKQLHLMLMKVVAAILGVSLGELTQRDKAYQLEKEKARSRTLKRWLAAVGLASVAAIAFAGLARHQQLQAQQNYQEAQARTRSLYASLSEVAYNEGRTIEGIQYALLSHPDPASYPALFRGMMENREVFLETPKDYEPLVQNRNRLLIPLTDDAQYQNCGQDAAFAIMQAEQQVAIYCQPLGKLDKATPTLSPGGRWVISDRLLAEDTALYSVVEDGQFGSTLGTQEVGIGQIVDRGCVAFDKDERTVAYKTFNQQVQVDTFDEYGDLISSFTLQTDACPVGFNGDKLLITRQGESLRAWQTKLDNAPIRSRNLEYDFPEPSSLTAMSPDGLVQVTLNVDSDQANQLDLLDVRTGSLVYQHRNLETEFISSATGYNYPWKVVFAPDGNAIEVYGLAGTTKLPFFADNSQLITTAQRKLPCYKGSHAYQSSQTKMLCTLLSEMKVTNE